MMAPLNSSPIPATHAYTIDSDDEEESDTLGIETVSSMETSHGGKRRGYDTLDPLAESQEVKERKKRIKQRFLLSALIAFILLIVKVQHGGSNVEDVTTPATSPDVEGKDDVSPPVAMYDDDDDDDYYKNDDEDGGIDVNPSTPNETEGSNDQDATENDTDGTKENESGSATESTNESDTDSTDAKDDEAPVFEDNFYLQQKELSDDEKDALIEKWGKWHFWDGDPESRPTCDYLAGYPNGDIPAEDFPEDAWQTDAVYVNHFLDSAAELVRRAKESIYTEYGWGPREDLDLDQLIDRMDMFQMDFVDLDTDPDSVQKPPESSATNGGWTTEKSFEGLSKRLLHAMMTQDDFTVVMGGHSAAAGHGNHFLQSYMMQFHKIMEPIFRRLGMNLITRNIAQGGLGTLQGTLGAGSIYGDKIDMMLWDSSMTEKGSAEIDLFLRQALIAGQRPPVLWGAKFDLLKELYIHADADVMQPGSGMVGIPETENLKQVKDLPFAAQFLKCSKACKDICDSRENRFRTTCWVERDDITPPTEQMDHAGSQVSWHPGFRNHQLTGRVLAFTVLDALQDALDKWSEITIFSGFPIADEYWHITDHFENIQSKARALGPDIGSCSNIKGLPTRVCNTPLKGRTEFTPRANPDQTSIISILKPTPDGYIPSKKEELLYDGPDVPNPSLMVPEDETDVRAIVSNRRQLSHSEIVQHDLSSQIDVEKQGTVGSGEEYSFNELNNLRRRTESADIVPGKGWELDALPGYCDGTSSGICHRIASSNCLLYGHMDHRGGLSGNPLSGWLVMTVPDVKKGLIMLKMETFHKQNQIDVTKDWTEVNDGEYNRQLGKDEEAYNYPENFVFEYAINGEVTSLNKAEFKEKLHRAERVVEVLTILDDETFSKNGEAQEVEVAIRLLNSEHMPVFKLTHVYWA